MLGDLINNVSKLNRLSKLYHAAIANCKPYRVSRVRNLYENELNNIQTNHTVSTLDTHKYQTIFGSDVKLIYLLEKKELAVKKGQYEIAAQLRDQEKAVLVQKLANMGFNVNDNFIVIGDEIYQLPK